MIKNKTALLLLVVVFFFSLTAIQCRIGDILFDSNDDFKIVFDDDDEEDDFFGWLDEDSIEEDLSRACPEPEDPLQISEEEVLPFISLIIEEPIWRRTYQPRTRGSSYLYPLSRLRILEKQGFFMTPFYNLTDKVTTPLINDLALDIDPDVLIAFLNQINTMAEAEGVSIDAQGIANILPILKRLRIQERKGGVGFQLNWKTGPFMFHIDIPFLIAERNLFADPKVERELRELVLEVFGADPGDMFVVEREFARINLGIGDTRFRISLPTLDTQYLQVNLGAGMIIPTATGTILDGKWKNPAETEFNNSLDFLINSLRTTLLVAPLGNDDHWVFSPYLDFRVPIYGDAFSFRGYLSYDSLFTSGFSSKEKRLIMDKQTLTCQEISREIQATNEDVLEQFKRQFLLPCEYNVKLDPGDVFEATFYLDRTIRKWSIAIGYDYFLKQREVLHWICNSDVEVGSLRVDDAVAPRFSQHKLLFETTYRTTSHRTTFGLTLGGDYTIASNGAGRDWTVYTRLGIMF